MTLVYILSDYEEDGARNIHATLDPARLPELLTKIPSHPTYAEEAQRELAVLLNDGIRVGRHPLVFGWGGPVLDVVELE